MDTRKYTGALIATLFSLAIFLVLPLPTHAITVGPAKLEYSVNPGDVITGKMYLKNEEGDTKTFYPTVDKFTEQNGIKNFIKDQSLIAEWLSTDSSVTLAPGKDKDIPFTLTIPKNAPPGGQFAVVWWGTNPPGTDATKQVSIQTRAGILVYINVSGDIKESAKISNFTTEGNKTVFLNNIVPFGMVIANDGNVYIKPHGEIKVTSLFGKTQAVLPINAKGFQILPESTRSFGEDMIWTAGSFFIGPYKVTATVVYGDSNTTITQSFWIWMFPIKTFLIIIGSLLALIIILRIFFKRYNRWLIQKYSKK